MTTQDQIIIICILAFIAVPLGTFITIKTINKLSRSPVNTLNRTGDIELVDYIEPLQPLNTYYPNQFDLVNNQFSVLERISYAPTYYTGANPPFYRSGTLPIYQSVEGININSCLENDFILNYQFKFIVLGVILFSWISYKKSINLNMSSLIPFCSYDIDFRDSFDWEISSYRVKPKISYLKIQSLTKDIKNLLDSLNDDENYSMSLSYISSYKEWKDNKDKINPNWIDNAIIINKESDSVLITQFIMQNLNKKGYFITNQLFNDDLINKIDPVILIVTVPIKVKI